MRDRILARDSGMGRLVCLIVLVAALLGCVLPVAASASGRFARSRVDRPYSVCPKATYLEIQCMMIRVPIVPANSADAIAPAFEGTGEGGAYDPKDLREAYKLPETGGSGQTVAIVDAYNDPNAESDLQKYREKYKVYFKGTETACTKANGCFKKVNQLGEIEPKEWPANNEHWAGEISLDVDMVSAVCPECKILLVEATNNGNNAEGVPNLYIAEDEAATLGAIEISNSWGGGEYEGEESYDKYFDHAGIPVTFSAGDDGYGLEYPAASQDVISVGGTALKKESKSVRGWTEEVWRNTEKKVGEEQAGTGSGCSKYEKSKPTWQHDTGCKNRTDNDVAAVASQATPVSSYDTDVAEHPGWYDSSGTSVASPIIAGVEAHASSATKTLAADAFYKELTKLFHVSEGSNGTCTPPAEDEYLCHATKEGYNAPTGEGTPDGVFAATAAPSVTTGSATSVTETGATLNGTVNPNGLETKYYFEYGTTESYGSKTAEASAGSGESNVEESKAVTGLAPGKTYDFRIVAINSEGTTHGANQKFTATYWSIQELTGPKRSVGFGFWTTTCTSSTSCIAFGAYGKNSGTTVPLVEMWNGSAWSVQEPPSPTGAKMANVQGGSCVSSTDCVAVGEVENSSGTTVPLAETWNGTAWSVQEPPGPAGVKSSSLHVVSCPSSTSCIAAGEYYNSSGAKVPLAERWNGTSWSLQEPPSPTGTKESYLDGISCSSSTSCIAVGNFNGSSGLWVPLAEKWNGTTWSTEEPSLPSGGKHGLLASMSCSSSTACIADGGFENSSGKEVPLAERWNGTTWTAEELPTPTGAKSGGMWGVGCAPSAECIGVGEYENSSGKKVALAEKWNGTTWTAQEPSVPTGAKSSLLGGVSCTSSTACVTVGSFENSAGVRASLSETWNGTIWSIHEPTSPKGLMVNTKLWTVACTAATECLAVGAFENSLGARVPVAEKWNGTTWSVQEPPFPTEAKEAIIPGLSCTSSTACMAVGRFENSSGTHVALAEKWNGTAWSLQEPPNPTGAKATQLNAVSCASSTECIAIGEFENSSGTHVALAEKWNGTAWSLQEPPIPTGAKFSTLTSVSCTSSTWCVAVGYFLNSSSTWMPMAEKWNGTTWSVQEPPLPTGGRHGLLASVSCASSTACIADSGYENSSGKNMAYAERWNGTTWLAEELPTPAETKSSGMWGVGCAPSAECIAVGYFENSSGQEVALAEKWNGTTWVIEEPLIPTGAKASDLGNVACTSSAECTAVGSYKSSSSNEIAIAERYQ